MKLLVVLSGGQDSTTCLFWAKALTPDVELHAITFDYGQRHSIEIEAAKKVAKIAKVASHEIVQVPNCLHSTSPLISDNPLERYESHAQMERVIGQRVELTFVPMRNTLFLTIAANRAIELGCRGIVTGVCQEDNANYPDCRDEYIRALQRAFNLSLGGDHLDIYTPLMFMTKRETVELAWQMRQYGAIRALAYSHTSYDGKFPPTDMNHSNVLRAEGFLQADLPDPLVVRAQLEGLMELPSTPNYRLQRVNEIKRWM